MTEPAGPPAGPPAEVPPAGPAADVPPARRAPLATYDAGPSPARRRALIGLIALLALAGLAWVVWAASYQASPAAQVTMLGYRVVDDGHVQVRYQLSRDPATHLRCTLEAQNHYHEPVGRTTVDVPAGGDSTVGRNDVVRTTERAVTGLVVGCTAVTGR